LALSAYLGWHYVMGGTVIGCSGGSPCDQVLGSRWSTIGGVLPVSGLAAGAYMAMLVASFYLGTVTEATVRRMAWRALLVLVGAAAGSAVWFIIVQKWFIGAFCPYCMATHVTGLVLAALVIGQAPRSFADTATEVVPPNPTPVPGVSPLAVQPILTPWPALGVALLGVALAGLLAIGQVVFVPKPVLRSGASHVFSPLALNPHAVPLVGSPDAPCVVTLLFDYECPHCQRLHALLDETIDRYGGKLAFALCPAPLNTHCNPFIPRDVEAFKDSCELTRIALAVWVAKREAFPEFDRWMYYQEPGEPWRPRTVDDATAKAVALVGQAKFDAARADPWIDQYMQTSIRLFGGTGGGSVPKLVYGSRWMDPEPNDANDLVSMLQSSLAVPKP